MLYKKNGQKYIYSQKDQLSAVSCLFKLLICAIWQGMFVNKKNFVMNIKIKVK